MTENLKANLVEIGKKTFDIELSELFKVRDNIDVNFEQAVLSLSECRGKVVVTGIGKSGIIGHKISASLASTGTHSIYMNAAEGLHGDLGMINQDDIVIAISNSGSSTEVIQLIPSLKHIGVKIIAITGQTNSALAKSADIVLNNYVDNEACPMNFAPTSSTTATLVLGDALTVALIHLKKFKPRDFAIYHPGGTLGKQLITKVSDLMQPRENIALAHKSDSLLLVVDKLTRKNLGVVCIEENDKLIGIITDGDIRRCLNTYKEDFFKMSAIDIMTKDYRYISKNKLVYEALNMMEKEFLKISLIPVIDDDKFIGVIRMHDIYNNMY